MNVNARVRIGGVKKKDDMVVTHRGFYAFPPQGIALINIHLSGQLALHLPASVIDRAICSCMGEENSEVKGPESQIAKRDIDDGKPAEGRKEE